MTPRLLLTRAQAADALAVSLRHFELNVQPDLRLVKVGRRKLVPVAELERWVAQRSRDGRKRSAA